jgi:phage anti-repressor protein
MQNNEKISENANAPLIRVELNEQGQTVVSARELYAFLEVKTKFTTWCERMFAHEFIENQDYLLVSQKRETNNPKNPHTIETDYALTLDCAKQIAMLQRNDKGKQARLYFIDCEKKLKEVQNLVAQNTQQDVVSLKQEMALLRQEVQQNKDLMMNNFNKAAGYLEEMQDEIDELKENQKSSVSQLDNTEKRVDKIEDYLDFKSIACVYVFFCPHRKLYKFGSSHDAKGRKKQFSVVCAGLDIVYQIPTISRDEAYTLENALKKRFIKKHVEGEWYALDADDLEYLYEQQQNNRKHLARMA